MPFDESQPRDDHGRWSESQQADDASKAVAGAASLSQSIQLHRAAAKAHEAAHKMSGLQRHLHQAKFHRGQVQSMLNSFDRSIGAVRTQDVGPRYSPNATPFMRQGFK